MKASKRIALIGVPMDLGTHLRGVDMGPSAIRIAGLNDSLRQLGWRIRDLGNLSVPHAHVARRIEPEGKRDLPFAPPIARVCRELMQRVCEAFERREVPLVLGGDHSVAIGTLAGVAKFARKKRKKFGMLWVDAHGDCNTPDTTPSGNIHGMPLAVVLGEGIPLLTELAGAKPMIAAESSVLLGARDLDQGEKNNLKRLGLRIFTMREIDERGVSVCMREALEIVTRDTDGFHLSYDVDSLDPSVAPGVGTPVSGGLTIREAHLIMEMVADTGAMASCELVEVNPTLDQRNTTALLSSSLIQSAFGASIL